MESHTPHHLHKLLLHLKMRPKEFTASLGLDRPDRVYHILNGRNGVSADLARLIVSHYPRVSYEWLLSGSGPMLVADPVLEGLPVSNPHVMMVPLIGQYAYAGYLSGYADCEYLTNLPTMPFLSDHMGQGNYIAIEVKGDSMDDGTRDGYIEGDILLCREVPRHLWSDSKLHINKWNFVLLTDEGILLKRIIRHDLEANTLTIHSLNPFYPDRDIHLHHVRAIFNVVMSQRKERL